MFMSVVESVPGVSAYAELAGARVLVTGLSSRLGVDIARAFAEHRTQLVLQADEDSPEIAAVGALLAESASEIKLYSGAFLDAEAAVRFAQGPAQAFGRLDAVVNLVEIAEHELRGLADLDEIEDLVSAKLLAPALITRVLANRMALTWSEGLILNVVMTAPPADARAATLASILRAGLAAMTRAEAQQWAERGIRINAVGPRGLLPDEPSAGACLASESDLAALALYLASRRGRQLSGHVFDAAGVARRGY
jgi:3-oxoacyl-[acyl-carrier protein] reductase